MNDLERYFRDNTGRQIHKWHHYFEIYDRHLARFRGTDVHVLEFGVAQGGSMQMWKAYFGPRCRIYGVDKNPACKAVEEERVEVSSATRRTGSSCARSLPASRASTSSSTTAGTA